MALRRSRTWRRRWRSFRGTTAEIAISPEAVAGELGFARHRHQHTETPDLYFRRSELWEPLWEQSSVALGIIQGEAREFRREPQRPLVDLFEIGAGGCFDERNKNRGPVRHK